MERGKGSRGFRRPQGARRRGYVRYPRNNDRGAFSMESLSGKRESLDQLGRQNSGNGDGQKQFFGERGGQRRNFIGEYGQIQNYGAVGGGERPNISRKNHNPESYGQNSSTVKKLRKYPISTKDLDKLTTVAPDSVVLELLNEKSGFSILVEQDELHPIKYDLIVKVLAVATTSQAMKESLYHLLNKTCTKTFAINLMNYSLTLKRKFPEKALVFFTHLHAVLDTYCNAMILDAIKRLPNLVDTCLSTLTTMAVEGIVEEKLVNKYKELMDRLDEATKKFELEKNMDKEERRRQREREMDDMQPPDNFREISVLPTPLDIVDTERPFLRRNVLKGRYEDGEHYLDVQFRLMREDFVRPLREGIHKFQRDTKSRIMDVRIYRDATFVGTKLKYKKIYHEVKLSSLKKMHLQNSKRLMFGNLVCFSNDNFATLILGSVVERNSDKLQEGIIGIEFDSDINNHDLSGRFVMVESRAYFMAYKHVLQALKDMPSNIPMESYIVEVNSFIDPPQYLNLGDVYDLRVLRSKSMMKRSEAESQFLMHKLHEEQEEEGETNLETVIISNDIDEWPSMNELSLDRSQRSALHSALTRELAIIQGPPGTGKTFLGLKIVQTLLHNSEVWKRSDNPTPILVVCFTNHALDQFLEGMKSFTHSIVRVGGRTQSEIIEKYQINKLVQSVARSRNFPKNIHFQKIDAVNELFELEAGITACQQILQECDAARGIFTLDLFASENIIPDYIHKQLQGIQQKPKITHWLFHNASESIRKKEKTSTQQTNDEPDEADEVDEDQVQDNEELIEFEEKDRMIDDESDMPESNVKVNVVNYEVTKEKIQQELKTLEGILKKKQDENVELQYWILEGQLRALNYLGEPVDRDEAEALETQTTIDIWRINPLKKWELYNHWVENLKRKVRPMLDSLTREYQRKAKTLEEMKNAEYLYVMRKAAIVGMTTTGAATHYKLLQDLGPAIVVIEEAAEILEAHVIASLSQACQHLIMIGDHQQLPPSATVYELATKYGLETSLFERLIKNGLAFETLEYQHRMRPSISKILVPSIYPSLKDHPSVHNYPNVLGMVHNIFFITHQQLEREESDDNKSHENQHEAELLISLCGHLILQGYTSDDITILTAYSGQFFLLKRLQRENPICSKVRICVLDNFQGEENKIILLSLVRSNLKGTVGFLRTDNRVCVALSRAKWGFYITGNMNLLSQSSNLWRNIEKDLIQSGNLGDALPLRCENHPHEISWVSTSSDFQRKSPQGGCLQICGKSLPKCRHSCPQICHRNDLDHTEYRCRVNCPKTLCSLDHKCPKLCWEECGPCLVMLTKFLPCSHSHKIPCHVLPSAYDCPTIVVKVIPACGHEAPMPCHKKPTHFPCPHDCDTRLDCGHKCKKRCHRTKDPDHEEYMCMEPCTKVNKGCSQNHQCFLRCYQECGSCTVPLSKKLPCGHEAKKVECAQPVEEIKCQKECKRTLSCGHKCKKMCYSKCGNCMVLVKKVVPGCNHTIVVPCSQEATTENCDGSCPKTLPCGHMCKALCKEKCTSQCLELVNTPNKCPKNHPIKLPCHLKTKVQGEAAWDYCTEPCDKILECEHLCLGTCGRCLHGRVHQACNQPCGRPLVCGHICKYPCSVSCPPCQDQCQWRCTHSKCRKECGIPCEPCKENCQWKCKHLKCEKKCGEMCSRKPCEKSCNKKLKCKHDCIGFCGDPCPTLCRVCDYDELTDFVLLGNEEDPDSRFVLLEDCGHCIEVEGLEGWLKSGQSEIGMKTCPKCKKPIYNNRRYQHLVLKAYEGVKEVKNKYYRSGRNIKAKDIEIILQDPEVIHNFKSECLKVARKIGITQTQRGKGFEYLSILEKSLCYFQAQVLKKGTSIITQGQHLNVVMPKIRTLVAQIMEKTTSISPQMEEEVTCELQRLLILPSYLTFLEKSEINGNRAMMTIKIQLEVLMNPTIKFDSEHDDNVRRLLKESEQYIGGLGISKDERIMILQAMKLRQGHWYKCPKGHVYCITECGGAMMESRCPECGSVIGGGNHTLRGDNALATEMDGATYAAWSEQNNMGNFYLGDD